jgi:hypothetical protein
MRLRQIETVIRDGEVAEGQLRDGCDTPELRAQIADLQQQLAEARKRRDAHYGKAHAAERGAEAAGWQAAQPISWNNPSLNDKAYRDGQRGRMEQLGSEADAHRKNAEPIAAEVQRLELDLAAAEVRLLDAA